MRKIFAHLFASSSSEEDEEATATTASATSKVRAVLLAVLLTAHDDGAKVLRHHRCCATSQPVHKSARVSLSSAHERGRGGGARPSHAPREEAEGEKVSLTKILVNYINKLQLSSSFAFGREFPLLSARKLKLLAPALMRGAGREPASLSLSLSLGQPGPPRDYHQTRSMSSLRSPSRCALLLSRQ